MPLISHPSLFRAILVVALAAGLLWLSRGARGQATPVPGPGAAPGTGPATAPAATRPFFKVTETLLYKIPEGVKVTDSICSADSRHIACLETKDGAYWVAINGVRSPSLEWVVGRSLTMSPEGGRFAFQTQHDGLMFAVIGQAGPSWQALEQPGGYLVGRVLLSPDGKHFAYGMQREKGAKMSLVLDGKELALVDEVFVADMQFSADGKRFACRVRDGVKQFYIVDGAAQSGYDAVAGLTFSADGSRYGYLAQVAKEAMAVVDGKEGKRYAMALGLTFSADGRKYAYIIDAGAGPDGKLLNKQQLVYNAGAGEQAFSPFDRIGSIAFSPDGRRLALTGLTGEKWNLIVDGKVGGIYDGAGMLQFSPDSKRLALVAGRGRQQFITIDGRDLPLVDVIGPASFSPDGGRVAYVVRNGSQHWLMLDAERLGPATFFAFSPDSKHLGHARVMDGSEQWQVAIDGTGAGPGYDGFPTGSRIVWESPKVARLIAARAKEIYAVRVELE